MPGTCRFRAALNWTQGWNVFPPAMYSTKNIIYFLENVHELSLSFLSSHFATDELLDLVFTDMLESPLESRNSWAFFEHPLDYSHVKDITIEISTRKVYIGLDSMNESIPFNVNGLMKNSALSSKLMEKYQVTSRSLSDEELSKDLDYINKLIRIQFHDQVRLNVVTHVSLKIKETNAYIPKRHQLTQALEGICKEKGIRVFLPGQFIEQTFKEHVFMEDWLGDTYHWDTSNVRRKEFDKLFALWINNTGKTLKSFTFLDK